MGEGIGLPQAIELQMENCLKQFCPDRSYGAERPQVTSSYKVNGGNNVHLLANHATNYESIRHITFRIQALDIFLLLFYQPDMVNFKII